MLFQTVAAISFALLSFFVKLLYLNSSITPYEISYWKSLVTGTLLIITMKYYEVDYTVPEDVRWPLLYRGLGGFISNTLLFCALDLISLSKTAVLFWNNPIIIVIMAFFCLGEVITCIDLVSMILSLVGVILIEIPYTSEEDYIEYGYKEIIGFSLALLGSVFSASALVAMRKLGNELHFLVPPFYYSVFIAVLSPILLIIYFMIF